MYVLVVVPWEQTDQRERWMFLTADNDQDIYFNFYCNLWARQKEQKSCVVVTGGLIGGKEPEEQEQDKRIEACDL